MAKSKSSEKKESGTKKESYPLTSYTLGVLSVATSFSISIVGLILGIVGLVKNKNKGTEYKEISKNLNIIGIVIGAIALILNIVFMVTQGITNLPVQ